MYESTRFENAMDFENCTLNLSRYVTLCYVMLCYVVLCYAMLCYAFKYSNILIYDA